MLRERERESAYGASKTFIITDDFDFAVQTAECVYVMCKPK